jgi:hypothetical protein
LKQQAVSLFKEAIRIIRETQKGQEAAMYGATFWGTPVAPYTSTSPVKPVALT